MVRVRVPLSAAIRVPALAAALMLGAILVSAPLSAAALKGVFALLVLSTATFVAHALGGVRWSRTAAIGLATLIAATALTRSSGQFEVAGSRTWITLPAGTTITTSLYTRPDSARWAKFDQSALRPYVFFSMSGIEPGEGIATLKVNGVDFGRIDAIAGLRRFPLAYAVPLPWDLLTRSPWIDIQVTLGTGKQERMFTSPQVNRGWFQRQQRVAKGDESTTTMAFLRMQSEFVVEVRLADARDRVVAILY